MRELMNGMRKEGKEDMSIYDGAENSNKKRRN
jgi:hypothetical protein